MGVRYGISSKNTKILYIDRKNLYGYSMSQLLPYDEIRFDKSVELEELLNTPVDNDIGYFLGIDLK